MVAGGVAILMNQAKSATTAAASSTVTAAPTSNATKATTATSAATETTTSTAGGEVNVSCSGGTIDSSAFSAQVPSGWSCASTTGSLVVSDTKYDTLMVMNLPYTSDAAAVCTSLANTGTFTTLPDTQWGGRPAKTVAMESSGTEIHLRCVSVNDSVYYLMGMPITGTYDEVVAGADALTSGWTWK